MDFNHAYTSESILNVSTELDVDISIRGREMSRKWYFITAVADVVVPPCLSE